MSEAPGLGAALADRYRVEREIGAGGMATVYLAEDLKHRRRVAIKVLRAELGAEVGPERFLREIEISAQLHHPHILSLYDSGEAGGLLYYVMPYVEGESLRDRISREKQLPLDDALQIAREVGDALSYAHSRGVVHRDIKPENILLESGHAVVADFGIARAIAAAGGARLTSTGMAIGTPAYMSPEQAAGSGDVDGRSDLYSLGCVLYEMLAGQPPFMGPTVESVVHQHLVVEPPSVTTIRPAVPAPVAMALQRALAKAPADRFNPVALFTEALGGRASVLPSAASPAPLGAVATRARSWVRRAALGTAAVVVLAAAVVAVRALRGGVRGRNPGTTIAVLPFENLSAEPSLAYFAPGLQDELLTQLSKVAALTVISRTSVMGYQGTTKAVRIIGAELGAGSIVEGSVQVAGNRLRVNVQLIDAATDAHRWAEQYDRTLDDAFAVQSDIAQRIVAAVGAVVTAAEQGRLAATPTASADAYRLYLQGREYLNRPGVLRSDVDSARHVLERALALDPGFALGHAALSEAYGKWYWWGYDPTPETAARQWQEAQAALRLAPDLPQPHVAMGLALYWGRRDYRRALDEFRIALKGLPNDARLWGWMLAVYRRFGRWTEALAAFDKAALLDPRDAQLFLNEGGLTFLAMHRYADALSANRRALQLAPDLRVAAVRIGVVYVFWQGQLDSLAAALRPLPWNAELGPEGTAGAWLARLLLWKRQPDSILGFLAAARPAVFETQTSFVPAALYVGWAHELRGDRATARASFDSALVLLDSVVHARPDDWRAHASRGLALAGLGHRDDARREAQWLQRSVAYRDDALTGPVVAQARAEILGQVGDAGAALDEIRRLLAEPSFLSVRLLRLDPLWDPIRADPRFQALLAKHGDEGVR